MRIDELIDQFHAWCARHRTPATCQFYRSRLRLFETKFRGCDFAKITPLQIDEYLGEAGAGMSDSTRHHNAVALERLQKFALEHRLIERPVFGKLEKPRGGQRDRIPTAAETEALLTRASPEFRLIYAALRPCGNAAPGRGNCAG
ncbi:MAG TPA: site-specific integrase [Planctomycetaceae bacterium]|nr:site-specific integrase [Planctomycetaceae bacterium]